MEANRRARPTPFRELTVPEGVDLALIDDEVLAGLSGFRDGMPRPELVAPFDAWLLADASENRGARENSPGSNNWVISPGLTASGQVLLANDPHRGVTNPSLRYVVHLDAPGWTAIGSTEPVLPGVAIGHNGRVAWGLTIVGTDQSDVYVEQLNPEDPSQVRWQGGWEPLRVIRRHHPGEGRGARGRRGQVLPARPHLLRGRREPPGLCPSLHHARTRVHRVPGRPCA